MQQVRDLKDSIKEKDHALQTKTSECEKMKKQKPNLFLGKFDEKKILEEIKEMMKENEEVKRIARDL